MGVFIPEPEREEDGVWGYAIHRTGDDTWLADEESNGRHVSWLRDRSLANWLDSRAEAEGLAEINGLTEDDGDTVTLVDGVEIVRELRPYEEDYGPDETDRLLDGE